MNRNALIMTAMACLTVIFVTATWSPAQQKPADAQPVANIGRYQVAAMAYGFLDTTSGSTSKNVVVIDTVTGQVWVKTDGRNSLWRDYGSPAD